MNERGYRKSSLASHSPASWLDVLKEQVGSLNYGVVQIVVHDRQVVQIESTEKIRFQKVEDKSRSEH
jgi:hypothetical protein